MSDSYTPEKYDPTESVRTLTSDLYTEANMTLREHQDTDKHYIGESLPVPNISSIQPTSYVGSLGGSPLPARADHAHEVRDIYGHADSNGGAVYCPPGQTFISNWQYRSWGRNLLASGQVMTFPTQGLWMTHCNFQANRHGGGTFQNEINVLFFYQNGSYYKYIYRGSNFDIPTQLNISVVDLMLCGDNDNVQVAIQHNDAVAWDVYGLFLTAVRVCSTITA